MMWTRLFSAMALLALLSACSTVDLLNATAPRDGVGVRTSIAYGEGPRRKLDVYAPVVSKDAQAALVPGAQAAMGETAPKPIVVFFYGGGWTAGSRNIYHFLGSALAARGVAVVVPDYRLYPEIKFPGYMHDAAAAVAWARANAASFGGNPNKIFLMGHSAGAQIATLLALNGEYLGAVGMTPKDIAGVIGISGPYDFLPLTNPVYKDLFGPEKNWPLSQPVTFVTPGAPPVLLMTGTTDKIVWPRNTHRLAARLRESDNDVTVKLYPSVGHMTIMGAFSWPMAFLAPVRRDVLDFIAVHTGTKRQ